MTKDPVCGMALDETGGLGRVPKEVATASYQERTYHFCSDACKTKFLQDPARYAEASHSGARQK